jgi:hypothetical protein
MRYTVRISQGTKALLEEHRRGDRWATNAPVPLGDGTYTIQLDEDVHASLERLRRRGEDLDGVIKRLCMWGPR